MEDFISYRQTPYSLNAEKLQQPIDSVEQLKDSVLEILNERRASNIEVFANHNLAQYIIIAEHYTEPTLRATASHVSYLIKKVSNYSANCEGMKGSSWIIVDLEDVILHLFTQESRAQYSINELLEKHAEKYQDHLGIQTEGHLAS